MKSFDNVSSDGNEKAIRLGHTVPEGDVNLAYVSTPKITPKNNVIVIDTANLTEENRFENSEQTKLFYANEYGLLVDDNDNPLIPEEFPVISDVFSVDEDNDLIPGSEYTSRDILPFLHVSRHFHLSESGMLLPEEIIDFKSEFIKVVDEQGREYVHPDGTPRYKIKLIGANAFLPEGESFKDYWAYRVLAFVDTELNDSLYLTYSKVELRDSDVQLVERETGYREILNPKPFFEYDPEESNVVDPRNRDKKIFSTKPIYPRTTNNEIEFRKEGSGFKAFVPRKAISDPRFYQLFRWRIKCTFIRDNEVDVVTRSLSKIRVGIVVTSSDLGKSLPSRSAYCFWNMQNSDWNIHGFEFINPLRDDHSNSQKKKRDYWFVNIQEDDLNQFDLLVWASNDANFDISEHSAKIHNFTKVQGGTILVDTCGLNDLRDTMTGFVSAPVHSFLGTTVPRNIDHPYKDHVNPFTADGVDTHPLINGGEALGGWDLTENENNDEIGNSMSPTQVLLVDPGDEPSKYSQYIEELPTGYKPVIVANKTGTSDSFPVTVAREVPNGGYKILTTFGQTELCSVLYRELNNGIISPNFGETAYSTEPAYSGAVNSTTAEGAYKFLYNCILLAVQNRIISEENEEIASTRWSHYTPWLASWVIDGTNSSVLDSQEKDRYNFFLQEKNLLGENPDSTFVWKRQLSSKTIDELVEIDIAPLKLDPLFESRLKGTVREYEIELSNPFVQTNDVLIGGDYPAAWTEVYSPEFEVPEDFGPHVVKEEKDASGLIGREAEFSEALRFHDTVYPPKKYGGRVSASFVSSEERAIGFNNVEYTATARVDIKRTVTTVIPGETIVDVVQQGGTNVKKVTWANAYGSARPYKIDGFPNFGERVPVGLTTQLLESYDTQVAGLAARSYPAWGFYGSLGMVPEGEGNHSVRQLHVRFIKHLLNKFSDLSYFGATGAGTLDVDDPTFDAKTRDVLKGFQTTFQLRRKNGVADAETMYLLGVQVQRARAEGKFNQLAHPDFNSLLSQSYKIDRQRISDGNNNREFVQQSESYLGVSRLVDFYLITYPTEFSNVEWTQMSITPHLIGDTKDMEVNFVAVSNSPFSIHGGNSVSLHGPLKGMSTKVNHGVEKKFNLPPGTKGRYVAIGVSQRGGGGANTGLSKYIGVADIHMLTEETIPEIVDETVIEPEIIVEHFFETLIIKDVGTLNIEPFSTKTVQARLPSFPSNVEVLNAEWLSVTIDEPAASAVTREISPSGLMRFVTQAAELEVSESSANLGEAIPTGLGLFYSMDVNGKLDIVPEVGKVSKSEGIKLLCDIDRKPVGFPELPVDIGASEAQYHYATLNLETTGKHASVVMGFYDFAQKEFVVAADGSASMSFLEYMERGPHNIFVAVYSDFEKLDSRMIPSDTDSVFVPHKWAMPIYGVHLRGKSKIALDQLPPNLDYTDMWSIPVRNGVFEKTVYIRKKTEGPIVGFLNDYQGQTLRALYTLPEAEQVQPFSDIFGAPHVEVTDETPEILDDDLIQVRQVPISSFRRPTNIPGYADPVRPEFTVYKRSSISSDDWTPIPIDRIKDYSLSQGFIYLEDKLLSDDPRLLKVDYVSEKPYFELKHDGVRSLNLNAHHGLNTDLLDKPIYIYMLPHYLKTTEGEILPDSIRDRVLFSALDDSLFNPNDVNYDPTAVQLGIVYVSTALDPSETALVDTRRRGGGLTDDVTLEEAVNIIDESSSYWDLNHSSGFSYPKNSYVVIRLPESLKDQWTESEIYDIIQRNITAGVGFKIEDLNGNEWS